MAKITTLDGVTHDVEAGDKVRITLKSGDSSDFTVKVASFSSLESEHNFFGGDYIQSLEVIEKKQVPLPTKDGAIIGSPAYSGYITHQLSHDGQWYRVDTSCGGSIRPSSAEDVRRAMSTIPKFEVLYGGRG